jgi:mRNA interferase RelE/StbE
MTGYRLEFLPSARDDLASLDRAVAERVFKKLGWLAENFERLTPEPLGGGFAGLFKLRVGSYRAVFAYDERSRLLTVHLIAHRSRIYRV